MRYRNKTLKTLSHHTQNIQMQIVYMDGQKLRTNNFKWVEGLPQFNEDLIK